MNPGPTSGKECHPEANEELNACLVEDASEEQQKQYPLNEEREQRLSKKRTLARARFAAEDSEQIQQRLHRSRFRQARRREEEDDKARKAHLAVL